MYIEINIKFKDFLKVVTKKKEIFKFYTVTNQISTFVSIT